MSKKIDDFLRDVVRGFEGSISIHLLSCIGMVAVVPTSTLGWGFAFSFDLAATTLVLVYEILLFLWICRNFCVVFSRIDHIFDRSKGNSDPRLKNCLDSQKNFEFQFHIWSAENWSWLPIQVQFSCSLESVLFGCDDSSSRRRVYSRQATARNCLKITSVFGHEMLSHFDNTYKSCVHTKSTHFAFLWKWFDSFFVLLP